MATAAPCLLSDSEIARILKPQLSEPLWQNDKAYDAGAMLAPVIRYMQLHPSTLTANLVGAHISRFIKEGVAFYLSDPELNDLVKFRYAYALSEALKLKEIDSQLRLLLSQFLNRFLQYHWQDRYSIGLNGQIFEGGMRERLFWKLRSDKNILEKAHQGYLRAITDEEWFIGAISANMMLYAKDAQLKGDTIAHEILDSLDILIQQRLDIQRDGGLAIDTNVWKDYPDYKYAGHAFIVADMQPLAAPVTQAVDSSHTHVLAFFLPIMSQAVPRYQRVKYIRWAKALTEQFETHVLKLPDTESPFVRITNFMDGSNGVYRYGYKTLGEGVGYNPYQLSGALYTNWWCALPGKKIQKACKMLLEQLPLEVKAQQFYSGPIPAGASGTGTTAAYNGDATRLHICILQKIAERNF